MVYATQEMATALGVLLMLPSKHQTFLSSAVTAVTKVLLCDRRVEFKYKQAVTTADNFLGMSGKDPSTSSCEELVIAVQLPKAKSAAGGLSCCSTVC